MCAMDGAVGIIIIMVLRWLPARAAIIWRILLSLGLAPSIDFTTDGWMPTYFQACALLLNKIIASSYTDP